MKIIIRIISVILSVSLIFTLCCCSMMSPENCQEHIGEKRCKKCGLNYFNELVATIQNRATSTENGEYSVEAITENVDCTITYKSSENTVSVFLGYKKEDNKLIALFMLTMKATTGTTYGWALYSNEKMATGTFKAEDVTDLVFRPDIQSNGFTNDEFSLLNVFYEESLSFCVDALYSLLLNNKNNLKISDLGFKNYSPNV